MDGPSLVRLTGESVFEKVPQVVELVRVVVGVKPQANGLVF